jgi:ankyrin repeat protein
MNGSEMSTTTDFFDAIDRDDQAALEGLLAGRPDLAASRDDDGVSAVMHALYRGRRALAERLAATLPALEIFEAAALGRADRVRALLAEDPSLAQARSPDGFTPLHYPAFFGGPGSADAARALLTAGADARARSENDFWVLPLHSAAAGAHAEIVEVLLAAGVDRSPRQRRGWTPLHAAAQNGDARSVDALLAAGADPRLTNDEGQSAADVARAGGHAELAARLG